MKNPTINRTPAESESLRKERDALCDWMHYRPEHKPLAMGSREPRDTIPTSEWTPRMERRLKIITWLLFNLLRPFIPLLTDPPKLTWRRRGSLWR